MTAGQTPPSTPAEQLADRAYFGLRDRIVDLRLPPGSTLREDELMREMGIGRTPLREAVKRLALEHLVEVRPRRGTMVTDVHAEDIARFAEVRAELEPHAARLAAERMPDELREEAAAARDRAGGGGRGGRRGAHAPRRAHPPFAWRASGNPYLEATLEGYWALSLRVWHLVLDRVPVAAGRGARARGAPRRAAVRATARAPRRSCASTWSRSSARCSRPSRASRRPPRGGPGCAARCRPTGAARPAPGRRCRPPASSPSGRCRRCAGWGGAPRAGTRSGRARSSPA